MSRRTDHLERRVLAARKHRDKAIAELEALEKEYFRHRPLAAKEKSAILELWDQGEVLCCKDGLKNLEDAHIPTLWAQRISGWAYESLGCSAGDRTEAYRAYYRTKLVKTLESEEPFPLF